MGDPLVELVINLRSSKGKEAASVSTSQGLREALLLFVQDQNTKLHDTLSGTCWLPSSVPSAITESHKGQTSIEGAFLEVRAHVTDKMPVCAAGS